MCVEYLTESSIDGRPRDSVGLSDTILQSKPVSDGERILYLSEDNNQSAGGLMFIRSIMFIREREGVNQ